eukprot:TRINITY_DN5976_c0_g1_i3.p1 TRINITY_DN5976_c0_g1~~TRINITY_DN5976_c0_g1_i3.p1  ORF type:complete len:260 (+),score=40.56 TRINITY_DN5976_c0_g1_i3:312-1091(+)
MHAPLLPLSFLNVVLKLSKVTLPMMPLLEQCLKISAGFFLNLDYWTLGKENEVQIGRRIVDICAEMGVERIVYSSLEPIKKLTGLDVPWFDTKTEIEEHVRSKNFPSCAFVKFSNYYENFFTGYMKVAKDSDGSWKFSYPSGNQGITLVPVHDAGRVIAEVLKNADKWNGKSFGLAGDHLSGYEIAQIFSEVTGEPAKFVSSSLEEMKQKAEQSHNMWKFKMDNEAHMRNYVAESKAIVPDILNFRDWLTDYIKTHPLA